MSRQIRAAAALRRLRATVRHASSAGSAVKPVASIREVLNQPPPLADYNCFTTDPTLVDAVERQSGTWALSHLTAVGRIAGSAHAQDLAYQANKHAPSLVTHDRYGNRVDQVEFHPAYHELMKIGIENNASAWAWQNHDKPGAHTARSALSYMLYQMEAGTQCPQTMTYAAVPAIQRHLQSQPSLQGWYDKLVSGVYDPRDVTSTEKAGVTFGMSMTERQGGSDVQANTTVATPIDGGAGGCGPGNGYYLNGHKWFTSAPMSDAFLTLAKTPEGLSCFIVPRWIPTTGERNRGLIFHRLKDKLGDKSNASSEVEYVDAWGEMIGLPGKGVQNIVVMVQHTRLDCVVGSAGLIRRCVAEATHHAAHRQVFGSTLAETPIMKNVLADLAVESEASTALAFRLAASFDAAKDDPAEAAFGRIATAIGKYHICKRAPHVAFEAMECLGGNGYIEQGPMARLYRQSPLNAIWEGSGNVICLDVLRAMKRDPASIEALQGELCKVAGKDERYDAFLAKVLPMLKALPDNVGSARRAVGQLAVALQASVLLQSGHPAVADAFCASRFDTQIRSDFGVLPDTCDLDTILARATPSLA